MNHSTGRHLLSHTLRNINVWCKKNKPSLNSQKCCHVIYSTKTSSGNFRTTVNFCESRSDIRQTVIPMKNMASLLKF